jgi:hypothetical protein
MRHLALVFLLVLPHTAFADDDPDSRPSWEGGVGFRAPAMMHVGAWRALNLGIGGIVALRLDRLALNAEGDLLALWPASWHDGSVGTGVQGSEQRLGVNARWSFARSRGEWSHHRGIDERGTAEAYVETGLGLERIAIDTAPAYTRRDVQVGLGALFEAHDKGRMNLDLVTFYAFHLILADGEPTPGDTLARVAQPPSTTRDIGLSFDFGVLFGG